MLAVEEADASVDSADLLVVSPLHATMENSITAHRNNSKKRLTFIVSSFLFYGVL